MTDSSFSKITSQYDSSFLTDPAISGCGAVPRVARHLCLVHLCLVMAPIALASAAPLLRPRHARRTALHPKALHRTQ